MLQDPGHSSDEQLGRMHCDASSEPAAHVRYTDGMHLQGPGIWPALRDVVRMHCTCIAFR